MSIRYLICHGVGSQGEIYCGCELIARNSSWMEYLNDFFKIGWTIGMLCMMYRLNWNDLLTKGMCNEVYWVSDNMKEWSFMNLYMYQMSSPSHWGRANLGYETCWFSCLASNSLRSDGCGNVSLHFCKLITKTSFQIDRTSILTEFIVLQWVAKWLLSGNIMIKKFLPWKNAFSSFDRWWTVLFIWWMCNDMVWYNLKTKNIWSLNIIKLNIIKTKYYKNKYYIMKLYFSCWHTCPNIE